MFYFENKYVDWLYINELPRTTTVVCNGTAYDQCSVIIAFTMETLSRIVDEILIVCRLDLPVHVSELTEAAEHRRGATFS